MFIYKHFILHQILKNFEERNIVKILLTYILAFGIFLSNSFAFNLEHSAWNQVLKNYVISDKGVSFFQYSKLKENKNDLQSFNSYLHELSLVTENEFQKFNTQDQLAFLINAYNAFTVKLIIDHYPVKSIKDLGSLFQSPWKKKFFKLFQKEMYLDEIEHEMIRKKYNEPRIHFAVNCASKSCPPLRNEAFIGNKLEDQLENQTLAFINDSRRNKFDSVKRILTLSKIFDWYGEDFVKKSGSVKTFVKSKISLTEQQKITMDQSEIKYFDYDWLLNE